MKAHKIPSLLSTDGRLPAKATVGAAGFDCVAARREFLTSQDGELVPIEAKDAKAFDLVRYSTGLSLEVPEGYAVLTFARSSIAKMPLIMANTTGVVDSDFRGEISLTFRILNPNNIAETAYQIGDRIGQLMLVKVEDAEFIKTSKLTDSSRGSGAYGSTGR